MTITNIEQLASTEGMIFKTCQYLGGDPKQRQFCGDPTFEHYSYCQTHVYVCYQKEVPANDQRTN